MSARTFIFYPFEIQYVMRLRSYRILWRFIIRKSFKREVESARQISALCLIKREKKISIVLVQLMMINGIK